MSRTLLSFYSIDPGFAVNELMTVDLALPSQRYASEEARREFFDALDAGLRRQPGIEASAYAWGIPPAAGYSAGLLEAEGRQPLPTEMEYFTNLVSPTYFDATGTPLHAGRAFTHADGDEGVILSESFAQLLWSGEPAVGRRMRESPDDIWHTVVGVAGDVEARSWRGERSSLQMYRPLRSPPGWYARAAVRSQREYITQRLIVRASNPALVPQAVREHIRLLDPHQPVGTFISGAAIYAEPFAQQQFLLTAMGTLAGIALLLAALGIFGVLSQAVTRRRREIGIRVALGAGTARMVGMLVGRGVTLAAIGAALGTVASMAGARTLESLLFGVSPFDVVSFAGVVVLLLAVALVACWWPTRRALAVEPAEVLRSE
jgi:putative ABC transport system permease protein